ncbi:coadhesin-like [Mytilus galloprovincialis]|uniref:coadhesin-like n=1 Tax=Mytilus galloprovincialis TaxID=29158 RepID=UPI003F7C81FA
MAMDQILHLHVVKRIKIICFLSSFLISFDRTCSEVSGNWSEWSVWSSCSLSCGLGHISRWRECNSPIPSAGGKDCIGQDYGWLWCKIAGCPVHGSWGEWSSWNSCNATLNCEIQDRTRTCDNPTPSHGGRYCHGRFKESRLCNNIYCEIHGQWGSWQEWESCNTTYGNGFKNRSRNCDSPSPMFGGSDCIGLDFHIQNCSKDKNQDTNQVIKAEPSKQFSAGLLVAIAVGCSVVTAVVIIFGLFVFRRLNRNQNAEQNKMAGNNRRLGELPLPRQINDYERSRRSSDTQSGVYDIIEISGRANTQMNSNNEEVYEDLK